MELLLLPFGIGIVMLALFLVACGIGFTVFMFVLSAILNQRERGTAEKGDAKPSTYERDRKNF